ncbi:MAG: protocatechuate dioxygenase, partial [Pseudobdellovibrionaceae bacterium]
FEVFLNNSLTSRPIRISQIAFPQSITQAVYASSLYSGRGQNASVASFADDNVFDDGVQFQLATVSGDVSSGYQAQLNVGIVAI